MTEQKYKKSIVSLASRVQDAAKQDRLAFFVGAGVSKISKYPSWNELVYKFDSKIQKRDGKTVDPSQTIPRYSTEELLRIPEKYAAIDKDDYNKIIKEVFDDKTIKSNDIHNMIASFNPHYVLTTNYDHLLEEAWRKKFPYISVISCDKDIAHSISPKSVIKIHGGFKQTKDGFEFSGDQIVLKESDYLNYERNFPLIRNMTRTILATHTVVFVGYGLNDYNINLLFNWVQTIQQDNYIQPIFINAGHTPSSNSDRAYYEGRGIKIIDSCLLVSSEENEYEERYESALNFLLNEKESHYLSTPDECASYIYNKIAPTQNLKALLLDDLNDLFDNDYDFRAFYPLNPALNSNYLELFSLHYERGEYKAENHSLHSKVEEIISFFNSQGINVIKRFSMMSSRIINPIKRIENPIDIKSIAFNHDYQAICKLTSNHSEKEEDQFFKANFLYCLGQLDESYDIYTSLISKNFSIEHLWIVFVSYLNRREVYSIICHANEYQNSNVKNNIEAINQREMEGMDEINLFTSMPYDFQQKFPMLANLVGNDFNNSVFTHLIKDERLLSRKIDFHRSIYDIHETYFQLYSKLINWIHFLYENGIYVARIRFINNVFSDILVTLLKANKALGGNEFSVGGFQFICLSRFVPTEGLFFCENELVLQDLIIKDDPAITKYLSNLCDFIRGCNIVDERSSFKYRQFIKEAFSAFYLARDFNFSSEIVMDIIHFVFNFEWMHEEQFIVALVENIYRNQNADIRKKIAVVIEKHLIEILNIKLVGFEWVYNTDIFNFTVINDYDHLICYNLSKVIEKQTDFPSDAVSFINDYISFLSDSAKAHFEKISS